MNEVAKTERRRTMVHRRTDLGGYEVFYREAGPETAPVVLLPHGYPCSSYEFRNLMPKLGDRWRLIAPDFPGCGYSDTRMASLTTSTATLISCSAFASGSAL